MNYEVVFAFGIGVTVLAGIFWGTNRRLRGTPRDSSLLRRYAAFESEENALLGPIFLGLGVIALLVGGVGALLS